MALKMQPLQRVSEMQNAFRYWVCFLGGVVAPFVLAWLDLNSTRGHSSDTILYWALIVAAAFIVLLPLPVPTRFLIGLAWIPSLYVGILFFGLSYACERFGNCL